MFIYRLSNRNNNRIFPSFPVIFVRSHVYWRGWRERSSWNKYSWTHTHVKRSASSRLDYEYEKRVERGREEGREWRNPFDRHFHVLHFDSSMSASEIFLHLILRTPCFIPSFNPLARTSVAATKLCVKVCHNSGLTLQLLSSAIMMQFSRFSLPSLRDKIYNMKKICSPLFRIEIWFNSRK